MGTLTSAGGATLTGPFNIVSGAGGNVTSARNVTANQQFRVRADGRAQFGKGVTFESVVCAVDDFAFGGQIDVSGSAHFNRDINVSGSLDVQQFVCAAGGLDVSGATKVGILSADSITASGACNFEDEVTFRAPIAVTTALGNFAVVTAATSTNQSAPAWAESSAVDTWLSISVCGRNLAIPLVSSTIQ